MLNWLQDGCFREYEPDVTAVLGAYSMPEQSNSQQVVQAQEVMETRLITISPEAKAQSAFELFQIHGIQHLPVVSGDRVLGLVSDRDLFGQDWSRAEVQELMSRRLLTARPESALWAVARTMIDHRVNCILVVDADQCLQGLLTSLDILSCMTYQAPLDVWQ